MSSYYLQYYNFRKLDYENINNDGTYFSSKKNVVSNVNQDSQDIRPIQRPQPRKPPPGPGAIPPPPQQLIEDGMSGIINKYNI